MIDSSMTASRANKLSRGCCRRSLAAARQESGAGVLEMAFIAMFMFVLIAGVVDLGGAYQHYIIAINASREGARMYSRLPCTSATRAAVRAQVLSATLGEPKPEDENSKSGNQLVLTAGNVSISPDPAAGCPVPSAEVSVTVQVNYKSLMGPFWGATTFPIRARTSMMFYGKSE